jgi:signal transduction histidine kinase
MTVDPRIGSMHADLTKTKQILFNLLSNAAKFTSNGEVRLEASRRASAAGDLIEFVVTDTGIGLTDDQQLRLFKPFAQGDASISRKFGGTGLGLALVWRFCQLMKGEVTAWNVPDAGACFTVRLPAWVAASPAPADPAAADPEARLELQPEPV